MLELVLTAVAVVLALTQPVPQVVRLLRTRSVAGVSAATTWLGLVINVAWGVYGIARGLLPVAVLSSAYVVGYAVVAALLVANGKRSGMAHAAAAACGFAALTAVAGWVALGSALALSVGVQFVPQVVEAWRSTDLSGLAAGTYLVCLVDGVVWGGYGLVVGDVPLVLYGALMLAVAVAVLVPRRRWARAVVAAPVPANAAGS